MNDQDYIKAAVELADGWDMVGPQIIGEGAITLTRTNQMILDALAAHLVRQVDATHYLFESRNDGEAIVCNCDGSGKITKASEPYDRTRNTIKAIVDSGVL
jgi:hypothetical protein